MKIVLIGFILFLSSCQWLTERSHKSWVGDTIETLMEMSKRKSMIHDTPLKTVEALEAPDGFKLSKKEICKCGERLYGGILTVIANDVKESSIKGLCKGMGNCFFKGKAPSYFFSTCTEYVEKGPFKKMARHRDKEIPRFSKARRKLGTYCRKI